MPGTPDTAIAARARTSIRRVILILSAVFVLLTAVLLVLVRAERVNSAQLAQAEYQRHASYQAAIELMQTSNDLTRMARLYVSTGVIDYQRYYQRILDIRAGRAPRPGTYDPFYWDRVLDGRETPSDAGTPKALLDLLRELDFAPDELAALTTAQAESEKLARIEEAAMASITRKVTASRDTPLDNTAELASMVDDDYHHAKGRIMAGIQECLRLVDVRTSQRVEVLAAKGRHLRDWLLAAAVIELGLVLLVTGLVIGLILGPVDRLVAAARAVEREEYDTRVGPQRTVEFAGLAEAFNHMTAAIGRDIERRKANEIELAQARDAAEAATRAKSVFLATMSHEIRTPMIGVTGMLEVLSYSPLTPDQRREVAVIQQSAQALLTIISDILDFSKIEAGRMDLAPVTISLRHVIGATAQNFMPAASSVGLRLVVDFDDTLAAAHVADPVRLRQILSNFLSNALKFTQEGGVDVSVRVTGATATEQALEFAVTDTGIGVSEASQQKLFQPFAQAEQGTTRKFGGTGLGLTIARRLAELMGGTITMQSTLGRGTTMFLRVSLPIGDAAQIESLEGDAAREAVGRPRPESREAALAEGSLLLFAEDHPTNRLVLARQFALAGFWVDIVEDGALAYAAWQHERYAAVFTDLHMPNMDGLQLAQAIRSAEAADRTRPRTPVIALTAAAMVEDRDRCFAAGMDDVVIKPTTVPVLARTLRHFLPQLTWNGADDAAPASAGMTSAPADAIIDRAVLLDLAGGDDATANEILRDFTASTREDVTGVARQLEARDAAVVARLAHRIKGAARMIGATTLAGVAEEIEFAGRVSDWPTIEKTVRQLEPAFAQIETVHVRGG